MNLSTRQKRIEVLILGLKEENRKAARLFEELESLFEYEMRDLHAPATPERAKEAFVRMRKILS